MIGHINSAAFIWSKWMANMFWQVGLLIILIMAIDMAIRRRAWPHVRYVLWGMVFLKLLIPPTWYMPTGIVSSIQPTVSEHIPVQIENRFFVDRGTPASGITEPEQNQDSESAAAEKTTWQTTLFLIWIAGMFFFALMLTFQLSRLPKRSQGRHARNTPEWFDAVLNSASRRLRLKKTPTVIFSRNAGSPAVYGLFRPTLVLPEGYFEDLTREQAEHVLLHELCHIKRGDLWVHWFCIAVQIVYWFNPLLILARRQIGHVSEICCDLTVANVLKEKTAAYRETLLGISRRFLADAVKPGLGLLGIFEEPSRIITRLKWLELKTWENRKRKIAVTIFTILVMVVFVMPMSGRSQPSKKNKELPIQSPADDGSSAVDMAATGSPGKGGIALEATSEPLPPREEALIVSVNKAGQVFISDYEVAMDSLREKLNKILEGMESREVLMNADKTVPYGVVVRVMSEIKAAGIEKLGIVTDPETAVSTSSKPKEEVFLVSGEKVVPISEKMRSSSAYLTRISLRRTDVDSVMQSQTELMTQLTIKPYYEEGAEGLALSNIKPNSIFRRMGLRNGDILVAMDGQPLTSVEQALKLYEALKSSDTVSLELNRSGRVRTINYKIQ